MMIVMSGAYCYYFLLFIIFGCLQIVCVIQWRRFSLLFIFTLIINVFIAIFIISNFSVVTSSNLLGIFFCYYYRQNLHFFYECLYNEKFIIDFFNTFPCQFDHVHSPLMSYVKFILLVVLLVYFTTYSYQSILIYFVPFHYLPTHQHSTSPLTIIPIHYTL